MSKKLLAIVLVLAMVLALPVVAMADNTKPVATQATTQPSTIQSVTIGGVTASYQVDGYGNPSNPTYNNNQVFIRAMMPATNTEESLKSLTVVITMSFGKTITGGSLLTAYPGYNYDSFYDEYTFNGVNLLNTSYTIVIDGTTYIVAAGLNDSNRAHVEVPSTDPLSVSSFVYGTGGDAVNAEVYRITVQNPCMGNPFFVNNSNPNDNGWTFCNYFIKAINVDGSNLSATDISFTKDPGASVSGNISDVSGTTNVTAKANLSVSSPKLTISKNGNTRSYEMVALIPSTGMMYVTYGFNFDELKTATDYYYTDSLGNPSTVKAKADQIATDAAAYFHGTFDNPRGQIEVPIGCTVMYVVQEFMNQKSYPEYDPSSTYISSINGLAAFDTTGMDGWMYTDSAAGWSTSCNLPNVGAADYYLSAGDNITWFFTTDFTQYWNW